MVVKETKLRSNYQRLDDQVSGSVVDSIVIFPRSSGRLSMADSFSKFTPPPRHELKITSTDPANSGVSYEETLLGSEESYRVIYEVQNHKDSPTFVQIVLIEE